MIRRALLLGLLIKVFLVLPVFSWAGAKVKVAKDVSLELGFRLQTQAFTSNNAEANSSNDHDERFILRRARIRMGGSVTKWAKFFIQVGSDSEEDGRVGDAQVIDGFINLYLHDLAQIMMGELMAPGGRQHLTSSAALLAIDRPGIANYNLTWGLNGGAVFNTASFKDGDLDLPSDGNVHRDLGATLFGSTSFNDKAHAKYYVGAYSGIQFMNQEEDKERAAARVQVNFFDPEPGYYNLSTYLGQKKTIAIGGSFDRQKRIARDTLKDDNINYTWYSVDGFIEMPIGPGSATLEVGYNNLDLQNATSLRDDDFPPPKNAKETQGQGFYVQGGYHIQELKLQPWAAYEHWDSDASNDVGSWEAWKVGFSYFIKGHNANVKFGFEQFNADQKIGGEAERTINTFLLGFFMTY